MSQLSQAIVFMLDLGHSSRSEKVQVGRACVSSKE